MRDKLKFKSLSLRIWWMLAIMAVTLIFCISIIYSLIIGSIESDYSKNMLKQTHEFFMKDINYGKDMDAEVIRSLVRTQHILVEINELGKIGITPVGKKNMLEPNEVQVVKAEIVKFLEQPNIKVTEDVITIVYQPRKNIVNKQKIYMIISQVDKNHKDAYVVSYIKSDVKPIWQKEFTWICIAFIAGSFIIAKAIASYIIKPLKKLEAHAFKIANKDWVEPIKVETEDEIGSLMHSINYMQEELKRKEKDEQQFLQTISHDLKTPIMIIEGHAQAIIDEMYVDSLDYTAEVILKEAQRLEGKVAQMLYFNTLNYSLERVDKKTRISIDEVVKNIVDKFKVLGKDLKWDINIGETRDVFGNIEHMQVAIENILENQLRYAKSIIKVELKEDESIILIIGNDGVPVQPEAMDKLFDYHYKEKGGKYGLGLAITKKIICYYNGSISVENLDDGVRFVINLP